MLMSIIGYPSRKPICKRLKTIIDEIGHLKEKRDNKKISRSVYLDRFEALLTLKPSIWLFDEFINKAYRQLIKKHETELNEQLERRTEFGKVERLLQRQKRLRQYQKEYQKTLNLPCQFNQNGHDEANFENTKTNQEIVPHYQCEGILKEKNVIEALTTSSSWLQWTRSFLKSLTQVSWPLLLLSSFSFVRSAHSRSNSPWSNCPAQLFLNDTNFNGFTIRGVEQNGVVGFVLSFNKRYQWGWHCGFNNAFYFFTIK